MNGFGNSKKLTVKLIIAIIISTVLLLSATVITMSFAAWSADTDTDYAVNGVGIGKWNLNEQPEIPDKPTVTPTTNGKGIVILHADGTQEAVNSTLPAQAVAFNVNITVVAGDVIYICWDGNAVDPKNMSEFSWLEKVEGVNGAYKVLIGGTYHLNYASGTNILQP